MLVHAVLRYINQVAGLPFPAARLFGDAGIILICNVDIDVPMKVVTFAFQDIKYFVRHLPLLARATTAVDIVQVNVDRLDSQWHRGSGELTNLAMRRDLPGCVFRLENFFELFIFRRARDRKFDGWAPMIAVLRWHRAEWALLV